MCFVALKQNGTQSGQRGIKLMLLMVQEQGWWVCRGCVVAASPARSRSWAQPLHAPAQGRSCWLQDSSAPPVPSADLGVAQLIHMGNPLPTTQPFWFHLNFFYSSLNKLINRRVCIKKVFLFHILHSWSPLCIPPRSNKASQ